MKENEESLRIECDSSRDDVAYTYDIKPLVSGQGNPMPEIVVSFLVAVAFLSLGLFLLFGDVNVTPELFGSQTGTKIIVFVIMLSISCFFYYLPLLYVSEQKHTIAKNENLKRSLLTKQLMIKLRKEPVLNAVIFMILIILNVKNVNSSF